MQLRTPTAALVWELWRINRTTFVLDLFINAIFFPALLLWLKSLESARAIVEEIYPIFVLVGFFLIALCSMPLFLFFALAGPRNSSSLLKLSYIRPVSTGRFTAVCMVFVIINALANYAIPVCILDILGLASLPLLSGAVTMAAIAAALLTAYCAFPGTAIASVLVFSVFTFCAFGEGTMFGQVDANEIFPISFLHRMSWQGMLFEGISIFVFSAFLVYALSRQRMGNPIRPLAPVRRLWRTVLRLFAFRKKKPSLPFTSAQEAQLWFDYRKSVQPVLRWWLLFFLLIFLPLYILLVISDPMFLFGPEAIFIISIYLSLISVVPGLIISAKLSGVRLMPGSQAAPSVASYPVFELALPVHETALIKLRLRLLLKAMAFMNAVPILSYIFLLFLWVIFIFVDDSPTFFGVIFVILPITVLALFLPLTLLIELGALMLAIPYLSRGKALTALAVLFPSFFVLYILDVDTQRFSWLWPVLVAAFGVYLGGYAGMVLYRAHRWGLLRVRGMLVYFAGWVLAAGMLGFLCYAGDAPSWPGFILLAGAGLFLFSGPAFAPLALAERRHQ